MLLLHSIALTTTGFPGKFPAMASLQNGRTAPAFRLEEALERVRHWLPAQGPIKDFVHHNTLHAFQHLKFAEGLSAAARLYGARPYPPARFYQNAYRTGAISDRALGRALEQTFSDHTIRLAARTQMMSESLQTPAYKGVARSGLRSLWTARLGGTPLSRLAHPPLFRLIGGYLDQGLAPWRMPGADHLPFFEAVGTLVRSSWLPLYPYSSAEVRRLFDLSPTEAATQALARLVGSEALYETYCLEALLAQPGWAGLVAQCEREPSSLLSPRQITLSDYAAVTLITELGCLERALGKKWRPLAEAGLSPELERPLIPDAIRETDPKTIEDEQLLGVWQQAFEWSYYGPLLGGIVSVASSAQTSPRAPLSWAFFCIDDRECSLRRHVEEGDPTIDTFATAGFFGLDFMYRGAGDSVAAKHCPVPIRPRHLVVEEVTESSPLEVSSLLGKVHPLGPEPNTFFRGWILSYVLGFGAMLRLALSVFRPSLAPVLVPPLSTVDQRGRLRLTRNGQDEGKGDFQAGYTLEELADRVQSVLQSVGADEHWPKLVVFFGHGSSSVNNPYFAAYNCGACSGRPGSPNARAFAHAANLPEVRKILMSRGIEIPEKTWFVGALHDTSMDEVTYFDLEQVPQSLRSHLAKFRDSVEGALAANAAERCRRFEGVRTTVGPAEALKAVRKRSISLFEPRPEYNHATNACCIVGRRALTENLFLDRRAFLNSYDPTKDRDGSRLVGILSAVIPVCGGINLEYFFSRVDPDVYGAGSKLPQNVAGLIGVVNGIEGDLLTGLPTQMTEIHDPVRLLIVVEQRPEIALEAAKRSAGVFEWIANGWVLYACVDPQTAEASLYRDGRMEKLEGLEAPHDSWTSSLVARQHGRGNLPIGLIRRTGQEEIPPC